MQIFFFTLIGLLCMALLVFLFVHLGKKEKDSDPRRVEELWVRAHGDAAMVKMYYKAHSDEERAQIVSFIHSTCPQEYGPNGAAPLRPNMPPQEEMAEARPAEANNSLTDKLEDRLFGDLDEEAEEAPLSRKELRALRKKEKAAAKAAAKQAALAAALGIEEETPPADSFSMDNSQEQSPNAAPAQTDAWAQNDNQGLPLQNQSPQDNPELNQEEAAPTAEPVDDREMNIRARLDEIAQKAQAELAEVGKPTANVTGEQPEDQPEEKKFSGSICPTCGAQTFPDCQFCIICGQPLNQQQAKEKNSSFPFDELATFFSKKDEPDNLEPLNMEQLSNNQPQNEEVEEPSPQPSLVEPSDEQTEDILRPFVFSGEPLTQEAQAETAAPLAMRAEQKASAQPDGEPLPENTPVLDANTPAPESPEPKQQEEELTATAPERRIDMEAPAIAEEQTAPEPIAAVEETTATKEATKAEKQPRTVEEILAGLTAELTMELDQEELKLNAAAVADQPTEAALGGTAEAAKSLPEEVQTDRVGEASPAHDDAATNVFGEVKPAAAEEAPGNFPTEEAPTPAEPTAESQATPLTAYSNPPRLEDTIYTEFQFPDIFALNAELLGLEVTAEQAVPQNSSKESPEVSPKAERSETAAPANTTPETSAQPDAMEQQPTTNEQPPQEEKTAAAEEAIPAAAEVETAPSPAASLAATEQEPSPLSAFSPPPQLDDTIYGEFQMFSTAFSSAAALADDDWAQLQAQVSQQNKVIIEEAMAQSKEATKAKADPNDELHMLLNPLEYTIEDDLSATVAALSVELKGVQDVFDRWQEQENTEDDEELSANEQEAMIAGPENSATPERLVAQEPQEIAPQAAAVEERTPLASAAPAGTAYAGTTPAGSAFAEDAPAEPAPTEPMAAAANDAAAAATAEADNAEEEEPSEGEDSLLAATQRVLNKGKSSGRTVSDQLGLPETLSLEDILRNVRELEKRISEESGYHDEE